MTKAGPETDSGRGGRRAVRRVSACFRAGLHEQRESCRPAGTPRPAPRKPSTRKKRCTRIACVARSQPHPVGRYPPWRPSARRLATRRRGCRRVADTADEVRGRRTRPPEKPLLTASFRWKISAGLSGPKPPRSGGLGPVLAGPRQTRDCRARRERLRVGGVRARTAGHRGIPSNGGTFRRTCCTST